MSLSPFHSSVACKDSGFPRIESFPKHHDILKVIAQAHLSRSNVASKYSPSGDLDVIFTLRRHTRPSFPDDFYWSRCFSTHGDSRSVRLFLQKEPRRSHTLMITHAFGHLCQCLVSTGIGMTSSFFALYGESLPRIVVFEVAFKGRGTGVLSWRMVVVSVDLAQRSHSSTSQTGSGLARGLFALDRKSFP